MRSQTCSGKGILKITHNSGHYAALFFETIYLDAHVNDLRIKSDNGYQLTSTVYQKHSSKLGIEQETIHSQEKPVHVESYFGRFLKDQIYRRELVSFGNL